jgi:hypothetical protein
VPMGRSSWQQLEGVVLIARKFVDGTIRTATDQNLLLIGVTEEGRELLGAELARYGLIRSRFIDPGDRGLHGQTILQSRADGDQGLRIPVYWKSYADAMASRTESGSRLVDAPMRAHNTIRPILDSKG